MFKLTLASFVNTALLPIIFVKFGSFTPPTENPTHFEISTAIADCNSLPSIENTKNNATGSGPFVDGIVIRFDCETGFNPVGTSREYRCSGTQWVDGNLRCEEIFCSHVETPENGKVVNVPTYRVGTTIQFECNEGFDMVGSSNKMHCRIDSNWLPLGPPVCNIKMCGELGSIQYGETFQDNSYIIRNGYGSIVEVTCDEGYIIKGSPYVKCQADGTWGTKPTCELSTCPPYPVLNSSCIRDVYPFGPYLFINCRDDVPVTKTGPAQAECINGAWDYLNVACYCHCHVVADLQTVSLQNVEKGYLVHDKTLEWSCKNGYEKKMPNTFHCFDGNLIKPECIIKYKPTVKPETTTYIPLKPVTAEFGSTIYPPSESKSSGINETGVSVGAAAASVIGAVAVGILIGVICTLFIRTRKRIKTVNSRVQPNSQSQYESLNQEAENYHTYTDLKQSQ